jgi:PAS domain S-box-containing protein
VLFGRRSDGHEFPVEIGLNPLPSEQGLLVLAVRRRHQRAHGAGVGLPRPVRCLTLRTADRRRRRHRIAMVNRVLAESLGYTAALLVGKPLAGLLPDPLPACHHAALMAGYHSTGESRMMGQGRDLTALHADGTELPVEIGLSRVRWQRDR